MANADVEIRLRLNNQASQGIKKAEQDTQRASEKTATATERAAAKAAAAATRGANMQRSAFQRMSQAREQLGIRSERTIQREIQRTEAAYNRLKASGTMSWREQSRAADQMRQRVTQLTNEMGKLTARQKAMGALNTVRNVGAGVIGASYAVQEPARQYVDYSLRLARMANTAFEERDTEGRLLGAKELNEAVMRATREGGGSRDDAATALDSMIASGAVNTSDAMKMLPQIMKAATASGASAEEMANIAIRSMQNFDISAEELPRIFNMAVAAGKAGGFELKDMSRWLPQQLASAKMSGMSGRDDFAALAALNQAAAITAGTKDEAGNNVVNLLSKINSRDTALDAKRLGVNLSKELQDARAKGVNSLDAFGGVVAKIMEKNPAYRKLQARLSTETDEEKKKTYESMSQIAQGSAVGQIVQDKQALMALMAFLNNQGYMQDVREKVLANDVESGGAVDKDMEVIRRTAAFSAWQKDAARENAQFMAMENVAPAMIAWNEGVTELNTRFPALAGSLDLASKAAIGFAAAAGLSSMLGGGKPGSAVRGLGRLAGGAGRAVASGAGRIVAARGLSLGAGMASAGGATTGAAVAGSAAAGYLLGTYVVNPAINKIVSKVTGNKDETLGTWLYDLLNKDKTAELEKMYTSIPFHQKQDVDVNAQLKIDLAPGLVITGQKMDASGGNVKMGTGNIDTGAPS